MSENVLQGLLVSEEDLLNQAVQKAKSIFSIEKTTGNIILKVSKASLTARAAIGIQLVGRYFSHRLKIASSQTMSAGAISSSTGIETATVTARLAEMTDSGLVNRIGKGEFSINPYSITEFLDEVMYSSNRDSRSVSKGIDGSENSSENLSDSFPDIGKFDSLTDAITNLLQSDWGKKSPRDWREIQQALRHNSMIHSDGNVTGTLTLMYQGRKLKRIKEGKSFRYYVQ